jgi:hypothetical protein
LRAILLVKKIPCFYRPKNSIPFSQKPTSEPYTNLAESRKEERVIGYNRGGITEERKKAKNKNLHSTNGILHIQGDFFKTSNITSMVLLTAFVSHTSLLQNIFRSHFLLHQPSMNYPLCIDNQVRLENDCLSLRKHFKDSQILTHMILKRLGINQLLTLKYNERTPFRSRHTTYC